MSAKKRNYTLSSVNHSENTLQSFRKGAPAKSESVNEPPEYLLNLDQLRNTYEIEQATIELNNEDHLQY